MKKRVDLLKLGAQYLNAEGIISARREAEILLCYVLDCPRIELYLDNLVVKEESSLYYRGLLAARAKGFPLQYLVGSTEFMGLRFKVRPGVFIPRPETEVLVETVLNYLSFTFHGQPNILDIGTGCGNIAISIAKNLKKAYIFACDISNSALQLTKENSDLNKVRIKLVQSNLFSAFKKKRIFSLIVSNPPYIDSGEIDRLPLELHYEPRLALDGGESGLSYYAKIIHQAPAYLKDDGLVIMEVGDNQAALVRRLFEQSQAFSLVETVKDYNNIERVIVARKINSHG